MFGKTSNKGILEIMMMMKKKQSNNYKNKTNIGLGRSIVKTLN
jgi:hypothetical protein